MQAEYEPNYGADRDGNRGIPAWNIELDDSLEEREEVAEQIYDALIEDNEINLNQFNVVLTHITRSNCIYDTKYDETFCDEIEIKFDTNISPIDYMDLVVPMMLDGVDDWDVDEVSRLLYLERGLVEAKYEGKELAQLTKAVEPFREEWKRDFLGEER